MSTDSRTGQLPSSLLTPPTQLGDSLPWQEPPQWQCNLMLEGDCLEKMSYLPDHSVNLILCDLPYGTTHNKWDSIIDLHKLWEHYRRILAPRGIVVLTGQGRFTARLIMSNERWFRYKWTWVKSKATNFLNAKRQPLRRHEDLCIFYEKPGIYHAQMQPGSAYNKGRRKAQMTGSYGDFTPSVVKTEGGRYPTDVVYFKTAESEGKVWHPTQKPLALARYLVRTYTNPGQVVLDNAAGSGSFLVGALMEGRNVVGIELNEQNRLFKKEPIDLIAVCNLRLQEAYEQLHPDVKAKLAPPHFERISTELEAS